MKRNLLIASAAAFAVIAGGAAANPHKSHSMTARGDSYALPEQPIPYDQVDAYVKGTPRQKAAIVAKAKGEGDTQTEAQAQPPAQTPANDPPASPSATDPPAGANGYTDGTSTGAPVPPGTMTPPSSSTSPNTPSTEPQVSPPAATDTTTQPPVDNTATPPPPK